MISWSVTDISQSSHQQQNLATPFFQHLTRVVSYSTNDPVSQIRRIILNQYNDRAPEVIIIAISIEAAFEIRVSSLSLPDGVNLYSDAVNNSLTISGIGNDNIVEHLLTMMEIYSGDVSNQLDESNLRSGLGIAIRMAVSDHQIANTYSSILSNNVELDEHYGYDEDDDKLAFHPKLGA